jgi:hypothetical protein
MKPDAASLWIENRIGQQVVRVNQHRGQHDERRPLPAVAEENPSRGHWHSGVQQQMDNGTQCHAYRAVT